MQSVLPAAFHASKRLCIAPAKRATKRSLSVTCPRSDSSILSQRPHLNLASRDNDLLDLQQLPSSSIRTLELDEDDFMLATDFIGKEEQDALLRACLDKLDSTLSTPETRRLKKHARSQGRVTSRPDYAQIFLDDPDYVFENAHFDGVISKYRECTVSELPNAPPGVLESLFSLIPSDKRPPPAQPSQVPSDLSVHLLHLASDGEIRAHVDNVAASAGTIIGLSLGAEREIVFTHVDDASVRFSARLPPGSLYQMRGAVRYKFEHLIPASPPGQRLSLMLRDRLSQSEHVR